MQRRMESDHPETRTPANSEYPDVDVLRMQAQASFQAALLPDQRPAGLMEEQNQQQRQETLNRREPLPPRDGEPWENIIGTEAWQCQAVQDVLSKLRQENP